MRFYVVFRPLSPIEYADDRHIDQSLKDYYAIIYARSQEESVIIARDCYPKWRIIYKDGHEEFQKHNYSKGCVGTAGTKLPEDEADEIIENIYEQRRNNRAIEKAGNNNRELLSKDQLCEE